MIMLVCVFDIGRTSDMTQRSQEAVKLDIDSMMKMLTDTYDNMQQLRGRRIIHCHTRSTCHVLSHVSARLNSSNPCSSL